MKRFLPIILTLALLPVLAFSNTKSDSDGHRLIKLWQEYQKAQNKDLPKASASILERIKKEAKQQRLTWDYYDACERYVQVRVSSNWKLRDSLQQAFRAEIEAYGEPVAIYFMRRGQEPKALSEYISANEKALRKSSNPEFWDKDWRLGGYKFSPALKPYIKNDFDYCMWSLFAEDKMTEEYKSYPRNAFVDYQKIAYDERREEKLKAFTEKYEGKAAALLGKEDLLELKFEKLYPKGSSDDFKALRKECGALVSEGKAFGGSEKLIASCCKEAENLIFQMDSKELKFNVEDSFLKLSLRNSESVRVIIFKDKEKQWEYIQSNPKSSYFAQDKLNIPLPDLADGTYKVECSSGDIKESLQWEKYSISAAMRRNEEGLGIWAADFRSGKPFESVDIELLKDGKPVKTHKGLILNGFTLIPEGMQNLLETTGNYDYSLCVKSGKRSSRPLYAAGNYYIPEIKDNPAVQRGLILTDRSAFKPEETVQFKAILYSGIYSLKADVGAMVKALLKDVQGEVIEEKSLTSNAFGSVAGSFVLKRRERGGNYSISIERDGRQIAQKSILVDEFVLPTFDLIFDATPNFKYPIDNISIKGSLKAYSGHSLAGADITYSVTRNGDDWAEGKVLLSKDRFEISFPADSANKRWGDSYALSIKVTDVTGETMEFQKWIRVDYPYEPELELHHYFESLEGEDVIGAKAVAGTKETWMIAELYGSGNKLLDARIVHFSPSDGGFATTTLSYPYLAEYPDAVKLTLLYFQDKESYSYSVEKRRKDHSYDMPLSFERFLDTTAPDAQYSFTIRTGAGAEVAASIFDKSTERFMPNYWNNVRAELTPMPYIDFRESPGIDGGRRFYRGRNMYATKAAGDFMEVSVSEEEAIPFQLAQDEGSAASNAPEIAIREDFATTIAWEPCLKADAEGKVTFTFRNSDKLSTFYVQLFAHDAKMRNEALRKEMLVTIPVKISLVEPQFLYEGDKWNVRIGLSNNLAAEVSGELSVSFLNGSDYRRAPLILKKSERLTVSGGDSRFIDIPFEVGAGVETLGLKITFALESVLNASDGVFVSVPVHKTEQSLSEAHSALLLAGMDKSQLEAELRTAFVNVPGSAAQIREISIIDMVREALPQAIEPRCENAIALSSAIYAAALCDSLGVNPAFDRAEAIEKLRALQGQDGGVAWFKGMKSSPIITAIVLQRMHSLGIINEEAAVHFIDKEYFKHDKERWWHCGLSMENYLYTRSLFPNIKFKESATSEFRKAARKYLVPGKERGLSGAVFAKARRLLTLDMLTASEAGIALARKMGIKLFAASRLYRSIKADAASLAQYAEEHKHGGIYYPNAVMPWRGLLESELYAHSRICSLMELHGRSDIADGIRLWIMLQKETQNWKSDPGYIEAIAAVMKASPEVLSTRVLALSATYSMPFDEIKASGNGMSIGGKTLDSLKIGDRIRITWNITNEENRSFVHIVLPHTAGLVPVNQISGYRYGCYRSVFADRIELWYESYPEEKTTVSEEYYVTRAGSFQSPTAQIECLYAPHYRANAAAEERLIISNGSTEGI